MSSVEQAYPKLRAVDARPVTHNGQPSILLRDPLRLSDRTIVIPHALSPALALFDGTRDAGAVSAALAVRFGLPVASGTVDRLLTALDDALLLDNERFAQAHQEALTAYRKAPHRPLSSAGESYPADADQLRQQLQSYLGTVADVVPHDAQGRGLVSPHIDYARGGTVYARVWKRAVEMVRVADLVVLLGTDHYGEGNLITLTRQHYCTPFGVLPTAQGIVDQLAQAIGPQLAFAGELHHRGEHSIELAAIWLHHMRQGQPCELVPILCGSFQAFVQGEGTPEEDPTLSALCAALREVMAGRRALVVAAGDLSHVGPAFGGAPLGLIERARLQTADEELLAAMCAGDAQGFYGAIQRDGDRRNVCGLPPIYLALRLLAPVSGEQVAYERCPADERGTSWVSVCGVVWE
jgi:AmmeMemoRadiSam system protein B